MLTKNLMSVMKSLGLLLLTCESALLNAQSNSTESNVFTLNTNFKDSDGDGVSDDAEVNIYTTNPLDVDSDGDGLHDGIEVRIQASSLNFSPSKDSKAALSMLLHIAGELDGILLPEEYEKLKLGGGMKLSLKKDNEACLEFLVESTNDLKTWKVISRVECPIEWNHSRQFIRISAPD